MATTASLSVCAAFLAEQIPSRQFHTNSGLHDTTTPTDTTHLQRNIINGKHVAASIKQRLKEEVQKIEKSLQVGKPGLALIQVGNREDSTKYVTAKQATAEEIGMNSFIYRFDNDVLDADILKTIEQLNMDTNVHGIVVQLPLPAELDKQLILDAIHPLKDVDGFQTRNSATALAVMDLLDYKNIVLEGKSAVIIGRSHLVGRPIADRLLERNATISICHSHTPLEQIKSLTKNADIVVSACGVPRMIKKDFLKPGCVVIDVGISREGDTIVGDVDFDQCQHVAQAITPVPGGVGPMTVSKLMDATMTAFKRIHNIPLEEEEMDQPASVTNVESGLNKEALENNLKSHEKLWAMSQ
eukprot:CAMPEP_0117435556 /NCGR_PEP_ID=MMETSP0759-20121206/543_1 /TAXON_ID=63605 /ORGANISM="Percolomonas cosmopolitus, Strain WS" /LENGTH=355 /DNA_ID=CAMNT_0005227109 /DNA_START=245 /DNA_END=1311 /DNA_ORIENTATION=+